MFGKNEIIFADNSLKVYVSRIGKIPICIDTENEDPESLFEVKIDKDRGVSTPSINLSLNDNYYMKLLLKKDGLISLYNEILKVTVKSYIGALYDKELSDEDLDIEICFLYDNIDCRSLSNEQKSNIFDAAIDIMDKCRYLHNEISFRKNGY